MYVSHGEYWNIFLVINKDYADRLFFRQLKHVLIEEIRNKIIILNAVRVFLDTIEFFHIKKSSGDKNVLKNLMLFI